MQQNMSQPLLSQMQEQWNQKKKEIREQFSHYEKVNQMTKSNSEMPFKNYLNQIQTNNADKTKKISNLRIQMIQFQQNHQQDLSICKNRQSKFTKINQLVSTNLMGSTNTFFGSLYCSQTDVYNGLSQKYYKNNNLLLLSQQEQYDKKVLMGQLESIKEEIKNVVETQQKEKQLQQQVDNQIEQFQSMILTMKDRTRELEEFKTMQDSRFEKLERVNKIALSKQKNQLYNLQMLKEKLQGSMDAQQNYLNFKKNKQEQEREKMDFIEDKIINYNIEIDTNRKILDEHNIKLNQIYKDYEKIIVANMNKDQIEKYIRTFIRLKELLVDGEISKTKISDIKQMKCQIEYTEILETAAERNTSRSYCSMVHENDRSYQTFNARSNTKIIRQQEIQKKEESYRALLKSYFQENDLKQLEVVVIDNYHRMIRKEKLCKQKYEALIEQKKNLIRKAQNMDSELELYKKNIRTQQVYDNIQDEKNKKLTLIQIQNDYKETNKNQTEKIIQQISKNRLMILRLFNNLLTQLFKLSLYVQKILKEEYVLDGEEQQQQVMKLVLYTKKYVMNAIKTGQNTQLVVMDNHYTQKMQEQFNISRSYSKQSSQQSSQCDDKDNNKDDVQYDGDIPRRMTIEDMNAMSLIQKTYYNHNADIENNENENENQLKNNMVLCNPIGVDFFVNASKLYFNYFYSSENMHQIHKFHKLYMTDMNLRFGLQRTQVIEYYRFLRNNFGDQGLCHIDQHISELEVQIDDIKLELIKQAFNFYEFVMKSIISQIRPNKKFNTDRLMDRKSKENRKDISNDFVRESINNIANRIQ